MKSDWYVIQTKSGEEEELKLFPGYLFVNTKEPEVMYKNVRMIPKFKRVLSDKESTKETSSAMNPGYIRTLDL